MPIKPLDSLITQNIPPTTAANQPDVSSTPRRANALQRIAYVGALALLGCDAPSPSDGDFRYVATIAAWDDVRCLTSGSIDRCFAHTPDADELWTPVVSWCELKRRLDEGEYMKKADGWWWSCDFMGTPATFDSFICVHINAAESVCFGGSNGWYTAVEPACLTDAYSLDAWTEPTCDADQDVGTHAFDSVRVPLTGVPDRARVVNGDDAFYAVPECALPTLYAAGNPWAC